MGYRICLALEGEKHIYSYRTGENENMGVAIGCIVVVKIDGCDLLSYGGK